MAISLATASDYLRRTTSLLDCKNGPATVMMWVKFAAAGAGYHTAWVQQDIATGLDYIWAGSIAAQNNIYESQSVGGAQTDTSITAIPAATWMHICIVRTGVSGTAWMVNGLVIGANSRNMTGSTLDEERVGNDGASDGGATIAYQREWNVVLTTTQILEEMQSTTPVHTANLWGSWSFDSDINDSSGNGRNWTQFGSATFVSPPTFPSNNIQANAIALTGSDSLTPAFGNGFITWYKYTPTASTEAVLSIFAVTSSLSDTIEIETFGAASTAYPASGSILSDNKPIQVPLLVGTTFYLRIYAQYPSASVTLKTQKGPVQPAPIGTILINDDTADFPLALLSPTTGLPLRFINPFPVGETVAVLNNGNVLLEDKANSLLRLLDPALNTIGSVAYPWGAGLVGALNSDRVAKFYASKFGASVAYQMDATGTVLDTFTLASSISVMCPNRANTILYYITAGTNQAVRRWDLVNDIAMTDLVAGVANHFAIKNLLVLSDNTVLVAYGKSTATTDYFVRHYSTAGATLGTYTLAAATEKINWLQLADDTLSTIVIWSFPTIDASSRFTFLNGSTGAAISASAVVPIYEVGVYQLAASLTPDAMFGHSKSCPIWLLAEAINPPIESETAIEYLIRRERWFPVLTDEQFRLFFLMLQIDLQAGNGLQVSQDEVGYDPILEIDWSDNGGWTWSNLHLVRTGRIGQYDRRAILRAMGSGRNRVYRIACSDPVQWSILNGYIQMVKGEH